MAERLNSSQVSAKSKIIRGQIIAFTDTITLQTLYPPKLLYVAGLLVRINLLTLRRDPREAPDNYPDGCRLCS